MRKKFRREIGPIFGSDGRLRRVLGGGLNAFSNEIYLEPQLPQDVAGQPEQADTGPTGTRAWPGPAAENTTGIDIRRVPLTPAQCGHCARLSRLLMPRRKLKRDEQSGHIYS
jgi:hypothetical protein